jgi:phosphohistidine phosphatase SixA
MAKSLEEARKKLDDEFGQVRRHLDNIHQALNKVEEAGPEDDLFELLDKLESAVKEVRTGGLIGHGAKGHRKAREEYLELKKG